MGWGFAVRPPLRAQKASGRVSRGVMDCSLGGQGFQGHTLPPSSLFREGLPNWQAFHFWGEGLLIVPRPKRVSFDCVSFKGMKPRQQAAAACDLEH